MAYKNPSICAVILTGGLSSRMGGGIKSLKKFNNKNIFDRILETISPQIEKIIINSNDNENIFNKYKLTVVKDNLKGHLGPLAGIHAALNWTNNNFSQAEWLLTVPNDTPFLPNNLVKKLYIKAKNKNKKIVLASSNNKVHPVVGLWNCNLYEDLNKSLLTGTRKIMLWAQRHPMDIENFDHNYFDPFFNINFKEDLIKAKEIEDNYCA